MEELKSIVTFIKETIDGLANFIKFIPTATSYLQTVMTYLPKEITGFMLCTITASIVMIIIGRQK